MEEERSPQQQPQKQPSTPNETSSIEDVAHWFKINYSDLVPTFAGLNGKDLLSLNQEQLRHWIKGPRSDVIYNCLHPSQLQLPPQAFTTTSTTTDLKPFYDQIEILYHYYYNMETLHLFSLLSQFLDNYFNPQKDEQIEFSLDDFGTDKIDKIENMDKVFIQVFPDLKTYPKDWSKNWSTNSFNLIVQSSTLQLFNDIFNWSKGLSKRSYGIYLAGPNGIGKSASLYQLCCFTRSKDFIVLYLPDCDVWCSLENEFEAKKYFFNALLISILPFLGEKTNDLLLSTKYPTWRDLLVGIGYFIEKKLVSDFYDLLSQTFLELCNQKKRTLLLCFDEINALFISKPKWGDRLAKDMSPFEVACTLNKTPMRRGLKILSGTGHSDYLTNAPPGTDTSCTEWLKPWNKLDFQKLVINCFEWPIEVKQLMGKDNVVFDFICSITGTIPREAREFYTIFMKVYRSDYGIKNCLDAARNEFLPTRTSTLVGRIKRYFSTVSNGQSMAENILKSLLFEKGNRFEPKLMDLSLLYWSECHYLPSTPFVCSAFAIYFKEIKLDQQNEQFKILTDKLLENDERSRAFERVLAYKIFISSRMTVTTTKIDGTDQRKENIECLFSKILKSSSSSFCISKESISTLYVPESKDFPVLDFVIVSPSKVTGIQITLQKLTNKISKTSTFCALFDSDKFNEVFKNKPYNMPRGETFIDSLLSLTSFNKGPIKQSFSRLEDSSGNDLENYFEYIIFTTHLVNEAYHDLAQNYPWVRVVDRSGLGDLWSPSIVESFPFF